MKSDPEITISDIAEKLRISTRAIEMQISKLKEKHTIKRVGPDKGGHWEIIDNIE